MAEVLQKLRARRGQPSSATQPSRASYGSRYFKGRNSQAGLQRERQMLTTVTQPMSPIMQAIQRNR